MILNTKTEWCWPFSLIFKPKESTFEILEELTEDEKALKRELLKQELISQIKAKKAGIERSIRG